MSIPKQGRPREYSLEPISTIPNHFYAESASILRELRMRVMDQVEDLPENALRFRPEGTMISIRALVIHLVWAEAGWISRIAGCDVPTDLRYDIDDIGRAFPAGVEPPESDMNAEELTQLCLRLEQAVTLPALERLELNPDAVIQSDTMDLIPKGVLMHLIWHWTYHSAHIGLIRELWGSDYIWTFGSLGG
jgi:uncharacterized damage-inducible protein DinB